MSLGLPRSGTVRLVPHSPAWATEYWLERGRILSVLGVRIQEIEHIGSTAIPGIAAKPIIDIAIAVPTLDVVDTLAPLMARILIQEISMTTSFAQFDGLRRHAPGRTAPTRCRSAGSIRWKSLAESCLIP